MEIKINIEDPEFSRYLKLFAKSNDMILCLWDFDQALRNKIKYNGEEDLQKARDLLHEYLNEYSIFLDDLC